MIGIGFVYDLWGFSGIPTSNECQYFVIFIDDYSQNIFVYHMHTKGDLFFVIQSFVALMESQYQTTIQFFRFDNAKEYISHLVEAYFVGKGILHDTSCSYAPPQNRWPIKRIGSFLK